MVNIDISDQTWKDLNNLKEVGESFDSVIIKLLNSRKTKIKSTEVYKQK